jgi:hypothetical protein
VSVALACTWRPRAEGRRWQQLGAQLGRLYQRVIVVVPTDADHEQVQSLPATLDIELHVASRPSCQRYEALQHAWRSGAGYIHCADGDRLLHWAETRFDELGAAVAAVQQSDCLIFGRSDRALATHPRTLRETEAIINAVGSYLLRQPVDLGGGARGFSRPPAQAVLRHAIPENFADGEWPVLAQRCGFRISTLAVDGLAWETPDHFQQRAADREWQRQVAEEYDQDPERWACRTQTAL